MKKINILAITCYSSGTGQLTETAQTGQGLHTFCLSHGVFNINPEDELEKLRQYLSKKKIRAVIFDNCWLPGKVTAISQSQLAFAAELYIDGTESFFLCRGDHVGDLSCELWRAYKPLKLHLDLPDFFHNTRIGTFVGSEAFDMKTGKVYPRGGGDGGLIRVQHAVSEYLAFWERDWPKIVETIKKELGL